MKAWLVATLALWSTTVVYAQSGVLTGSAFDSNHKPIPAATVYLQRAGEKQARTAQTDSAGVYRFTVTAGSYTVRAEDGRLGEAFAGPFSVTADKVTTVDLLIQPQYFDKPQFTVAGVTDNTYRGGHGSDTVLRSSEALTKATAALSTPVALERTGDPLTAVQQLQKAAELHPSEPNLFDWGTELLAHGAPEAAAEVFTNGARLFPRSVRMLLGLASAQYAAGSYEKAAECFFKAADAEPNDAKPYLFLGEVQRREITQSPGYEERLARFVKLQPDNALANYYYGVSLSSREEFEKAKGLFKRAVTLDPHLGPAYLQIGIIAARERNYSEAILNFRKAVQDNPELEEAHYRLSEAYRVTGDRVNAAQELAVYTRLSKQSAERLERERRKVQQFVVSLRNQ